MYNREFFFNFWRLRKSVVTCQKRWSLKFFKKKIFVPLLQIGFQFCSCHTYFRVLHFNSKRFRLDFNSKKVYFWICDNKQTVTKYFNELNTTTIKQIQKINFQVRNNDSLNENMSSYLVLFFLLDFTFLKYKFSLV